MAPWPYEENNNKHSSSKSDFDKLMESHKNRFNKQESKASAGMKLRKFVYSMVSNALHILRFWLIITAIMFLFVAAFEMAIYLAKLFSS